MAQKTWAKGPKIHRQTTKPVEDGQMLLCEPPRFASSITVSLPATEWKTPDPSTLPEWPAEAVGLDTETNGLRRDSEAVGISFAFRDGRSWYLPFGHQDGRDNLPRQVVVDYIQRQLKGRKAPVVCHNAAFDMEQIEKLGIPVTCPVRDTMLVEKLLNEWHHTYSLEATAARYGFEGKSEDQLNQALGNFKPEERKANLWRLPASQVGEYAERDALLPLRIYEQQIPEIKAQNLGAVTALEHRLLPVLVAMRMRGMRVDTSGLEQLQAKAKAEVVRQAKIVSERTGYTISPSTITNPRACAKALKREGNYEFEYTDAGHPSITQEWLERQNNPTCAALYRGLIFDKLDGTFIKNILDFSIDGRVHPSYLQMGAHTGRPSSKSPNLLNIPSRHPEIAKPIKQCFLPEEDHFLLERDFSGQELRMGIHIAAQYGFWGVDEAVQRFCDDPAFDMHGWIAKMGGISDRNLIKKTIFARVYGAKGWKIAVTLGLPPAFIDKRDHYSRIEVPLGTDKYKHPLFSNPDYYPGAGWEAQRLIDLIDRQAPYFGQTAKRMQEEMESQRYVTTVLGRRQRFYDLKKSYTAYNNADQGGCADQMKGGMITDFEAGHTPHLQIYDAMVSSIPYEGWEGAVASACDRMTNVMNLVVPSFVDRKMGPTWGDCTKAWRPAA